MANGPLYREWDNVGKKNARYYGSLAGVYSMLWPNINFMGQFVSALHDFEGLSGQMLLLCPCT